MGITTFTDPDRYGLTLVLGGGEVRLLDMTYAYGVFANNGIKAEPRFLLRIEDNRGNIVEETEVKTNRVLEENIAAMVSDVLSDNVARTPLWGANSLINFPNRDVAAKSGSTNNFRDAWIMGYAPNIAVGAWCGNNDNAPMKGLSGLITTPIWREFIDIALTKLPVETFPQPQINTAGIKPIIRGDYVDASLLMQTLTEQIADTEDKPTIDIQTIYNNIHSILYFVDRSDPLGGYPANPSSDSQYINWEYGVQKWKEETFGSLITQIASTSDSTDEDKETN
jgi:membrane peptidoglycan carboxypeptidase